jgi:hypothetical protein
MLLARRAGNASRTLRSVVFGAAALASCSDPAGPGTLSAPTNVTVTLLGPGSARVAWTASAESDRVVSYNVLRNGTKIGESTTTTYDDNTLVEGGTYSYNVSANAADGVTSDTSADSPAATITAPDVTAPTITSTSPTTGSTGVSSAATVAVTFSEAMDPTSISAATFVLRTAGGTSVAGTVSYAAATRIAEFKPDAALSSATAYTATVTTGVKDVAGNRLAADVTVSFSTRDEIPPAVSSVFPGNGATGIPASTIVSAVFSEPMDAATINGSTVTLRETSSGAAVAGTVTYNSSERTVSFAPSTALSNSTGYTLTITTEVKDLGGNAMTAAFASVFTTVAADTTSPAVSSTSPSNGAGGVAVGAAVQVTFTEPMEPATINATTIALRNSSTGAAVAGSVVYDISARTATFTPATALANATGYTLTVGTGVRDLAGNALAAVFTASFTTVAPADTTPPAVITTSPLNGATGVAVGTSVGVTFSEPMDPSTINGSTMSLRVTATGASVAGNVTYDPGSNLATFTPSSALANSTSYAAMVSTGVRDAVGNGMTTSFSFSFITVGAISPPAVVSTSPTNGASNVPVTSPVSATFSKDMDASTINGETFLLRVSSTGGTVAGSVSYNSGTLTATFTPTGGPLANGVGYTATITTGARDVSGLPLASDFILTFSTVPDATPPTVTSTSPANGATDVSTATSVTATFSKAMDAATINTATFTLRATSSGVHVSGTVSYNSGNTTATFLPSALLADGTNYTATVTTGAKDATGNPLAANFEFSFTTAAAPPPTGQDISGLPYFQGTDALDRIHFHITFTQSGQNVGLPSDCEPLPLANCGMFPLNQEGADIIGPPSPNMNGGAMIVAISGTFTDPGITFTVTLENGRTVTFTGTVSNSDKMTLVASGATLPPVDLELLRNP